MPQKKVMNPLVNNCTKKSPKNQIIEDNNNPETAKYFTVERLPQILEDVKKDYPGIPEAILLHSIKVAAGLSKLPPEDLKKHMKKYELMKTKIIQAEVSKQVSKQKVEEILERQADLHDELLASPPEESRVEDIE